MEGAGGSYVTADNVEDGDEYLIKKVSLAKKGDTGFKSDYINCDVEDDKGEESIVRLGVKNVRRVANKLGTKVKDWVGNYLVVLTTEFYSGLKATGIIWSARKAK